MHLQALPICTGVDNSSPRDDLVPHTIPHTMSSESPHPKTKQTIFYRDSGCMLIPEFNNTTRCSICAHTQSKFLKSASKRKRHLDEFGDIPFSDAAHNTGVIDTDLHIHDYPTNLLCVGLFVCSFLSICLVGLSVWLSDCIPIEMYPCTASC